jgi:general secretion pathway protein G
MSVLRRRQVTQKKGRGFSLIETLLVLMALAILTAGLSPALLKVIREGQVTRTIQDIETISAALLAFHRDTGRFPRDENELDDFNGDSTTPGDSGLLFNPGGLTGWNGPYVRKEIKENAFGGTITLERDLNLIDFTANGGKDVAIVFSNVPLLVALLVDLMLDDGNVACTGFGSGGAFASGRICFDDGAATGLRVAVAPDRG